MMKHPSIQLCKVVLLGIFIGAGTLPAADYHFSSSTGDDLNTGGYDSPWQTLAKASSIALQPGDSVLFKRGDRFVGHLVVNGSGTPGQVITIGAYGEGEQPVLTGQVGAAGGGDYQEAVLVRNHDNILFSGLEIQNERFISRPGVDDIDSYGIFVHNSGTEIMENFVFRDMTFRKVYGAKPILPEAGQDAFNGLEVAGIRFFSEKNRTAGKEKHIRNILIEDCLFTDLQRLGVHFKHAGGNSGIGNDYINRNAEIIVRNNEFQFTGGTCVLPSRTYNCLIENNMFYRPGSDSDPRMPNRGSSVWTWRCRNTVIQYNQCISIRGYLDSHGIHIDHENFDTFIQYNYMEDCEGGFVEILGGNKNAVYRFNVSVNDGWRENPNWANSNHTLWINENSPSGVHYCEYSYIYNNTVYMDSDYSTAIDIDAKYTFIYNNIFNAVKGTIGGKQVKVLSNGTPLFMKNNLFQGGIVNGFKNFDTAPVSGDPLFNNPASGNKYGYQLNVPMNDQNPAINAGVSEPGPPVPGAGTGVFLNVPAYPDVDFFGNPVDFFSGTLNIGACNAKAGESVTPPANPVQKIAVFPTSLSLGLSESAALTALTIPALADQGGVTWSSDNTSVASVDSNGSVTAHSDGWALITATSSNGKSDQCYVKAGNPAPGLSAIARQWMWDNGQDPDQVAMDDPGPSGQPLLLHYAMGVSALDTLPIEMALIDSQLSITFPGYRMDVAYAGESSANLVGWVPAAMTAPDHNGVRTVSAPASGEDRVFLRVQLD
jgi:hypothetical protein